MGAKFDSFRMILMNEKLEEFFKSSCFGYFLDLPGNNARFQMSMVYDILKRKINYKGDDDHAFKDKNKKMDEIRINYCASGLFWDERIYDSDWTKMSSFFKTSS